MTYTFVFKKCKNPECGAINWITADRCWYCDGDELEERTAEWQEISAVAGG